MKNKNLQPKNCNLFRIRRIAIEQQGFSLVELLISMAIASVVGMAGYVIFSSSNWSYKVQEDVSEAQQNVRVAMERLAGDVRTAGFGLPDPPFSLDFGGGNVFSSPITVTNSAAGPDTITILGIGYEAGTLQKGSETDCNDSGKGKICLDTLISINNFFSSDLSTFKTERKYISFNGVTFIELSTTQTERANKKLALGVPLTLDRNYPDNTTVYIIQAVQYTIAIDLTGCSATNPCLASNDLTELRDSGRQPLAENIEDIQFAYGIDESPRDGKLDDTADLAAGYAGTDFLNDPTDDSSIIAVRANIVAKTRNQDPKGATGFKSQCFEDRPVDAGTTNCAGAVSDGYRRRTLTKIMKLRNPKQGA